MQSKRNLEQQLAEVAAGRRSHVNTLDQDAVSRHEERLAEESRGVQGATLAASQDAARAAHASAQAQRDAAMAQQDAAAAQLRAAREAELAREEQAEHNASMEAIELRRVEDERRTNMHLKHAADMDALDAQRHRLNIEEAQERRVELERNQQEAHLLRISPSYAAASQLAWLQDLERPYRELASLREMYRAAMPLAQEFAQAMQHSDACFKPAEAERAPQLARDAAQSREDAVKRAHATVAVLEEERSRAQLALRDALPTWSLTTWFGEKARIRTETRRHLTEIGPRLTAAQEVARAQEASSVAATPTAETLRRERIRKLAVELRISERRDAIFTAMKAWACSEPRCHEIARRYECDRVKAPSVDASLCAILDQAFEGGAKAVNYPGLGELPRGEELIALATRVNELKALGSPFEQCSIEGAQELYWLGMACVTGIYEPERYLSNADRSEYKRLVRQCQAKPAYGLYGNEDLEFGLVEIAHPDDIAN